VSDTIPALGTLTDRVQLQRKHMTAEDEGGHAVSYLPVATVWARVRRLSARQDFADDARGQAITHSVVFRFRTDLKAGDRINYRGALLDIVSLGDINGRRAYRGCQCIERAVTG
jgi:SPP1 family predicted phage head-tail adaptor